MGGWRGVSHSILVVLVVLTDKGLVFSTLLSETSIAHIYQLIHFLSRSESNGLNPPPAVAGVRPPTACYLFPDLQVEGLFRVPGNSARQQNLKELLTSGADVDLESGDFHPNDAATLLKSFLGELPEPLLTHRHFHAHLKIAGQTLTPPPPHFQDARASVHHVVLPVALADMMLFDDQGNKTSVPNRERQLEALQLLLLLLPQANRSLLKLLLDLLHHTARQQDKNKMSAFNLALMFAPHVLWPRHVRWLSLPAFRGRGFDGQRVQPAQVLHGHTPGVHPLCPLSSVLCPADECC